MATFIEYTGEMNIPEEKREILAEQMEKVLNFGGMMDFEVVHLFGFELGLMRPFHADPERRAEFFYNYFEDDSWEGGEFDMAKGTLMSGGVGWSELHDVTLAAYFLLAMYDEDPGCPAVDDSPVASTFAVGWLNHLLGTRFSMKPFFDLFANAEKYAMLSDPPFLGSMATVDMLPDGMEYEACGTDFADLMYISEGTESLDQDDVLPGTYPDDVRKAREAVRLFLNRKGEEDSLERLWAFLKSDREKRMAMTDLSPLPELSLILPARVFIFLAAQERNLKFWRLWKDLRDHVYQDQQMKPYASRSLEKIRRERAEAPVKPVSTLRYLKQSENVLFTNNVGKSCYRLSDDDRLYWWDPESDEVILSEEMDRWLSDLSNRHRAILESLKKNPPESDSFMEDFVNVLGRVNQAYKNVFPFQSMFYEFVRNGGKKKYAAAVELYKELARENWEEGKILQKDDRDWSGIGKSVRCNPGRTRLRRYLGVMANRKLRKRYFGF